MMLLRQLFIFFMINHSDSQEVITIKKVPVQEGKSIIIPCSYDQVYLPNLKYLCAGSIWIFCKYVEYSNQKNAHKTVSIIDEKKQATFTVTIKNLTTSDSGSYWCCVEIDQANDIGNHFQLQVSEAHPPLYVENQMVTGLENSNVSIHCHHSIKKPTKWCKLGGQCVERGQNISLSSELIESDDSFRVTIRNLSMKHAGWYYCSTGDLQMPVHISIIRNSPIQTTAVQQNRSLQKKTLILLVVMLAVACTAVILIIILKQICKRNASPEHNRSENIYISMHGKESSTISKKSGDQKCEDEETYEMMIKKIPSGGGSDTYEELPFLTPAAPADWTLK